MSTVAFDTTVNPERKPVLASAPIELVPLEALPGVCSEHGLPAVARPLCTVDSSGPLSELPTWRSMLRFMKSGGDLPVARVRFECPACEYCLAGVRRSRWVAWSALLAVPVTIVAILLAARFGLEQLYIPLGFALLPGCMPLALMVALLSWSRSGYFADVWLNADDQLVVSAHPSFVAEVERSRAAGER